MDLLSSLHRILNRSSVFHAPQPTQTPSQRAFGVTDKRVQVLPFSALLFSEELRQAVHAVQRHGQCVQGAFDPVLVFLRAEFLPVLLPFPDHGWRLSFSHWHHQFTSASRFFDNALNPSICLGADCDFMISLLVFDEKGPIPVGNVTIPQKTVIPQRGTIIEVRYLSANPGGALYQPVYLGVRDDLDRSACTVAQLKYRAEDPDGNEP